MSKINEDKDKIAFWMPAIFEKGKDEKTGKVKMKMKGIASTIDEDLDEEILEPAGFELDLFKTQGMVNWHHGSKVNPKANIGEPTVAKITKDNEFYVEVDLYPSNKLAKDVYEFAEILEKDSLTRRLGFSVEGKAIERDPTNEKRITKAKITGLAVTHMPKNPATVCEIMKGVKDGLDMEWDGWNMQDLMKGDEKDDVEKTLDTTSGKPLMPESLEGSPKRAETKDKKKKEDDEEDDEGNKVLSKAEVYQKIFDDFSDIDIVKAKKVYCLIEKIAQMSKKNITDDTLNKAYGALGIPNGDDLEKGDIGGEITTYFKEIKKGCGTYKKFKKTTDKEKDKDKKDEVVDDKEYIKKGEDFVEKEISKSVDDDVSGDAASDDDATDDATVDAVSNAGGDVTDDVSKGQGDDLNKSDFDFVKAFGTLNDSISTMGSNNAGMFKAVGTVLRGLKEGYDELDKKQIEFQKAVGDAFKQFGSAPIGQRKSVEGVNAINKAFEGEGDITGEGAAARRDANTVSLSGDRVQVLNILSGLTFSKGSENEFNEFYGNGLSVYESSGILPEDIKKAVELEKKISIID